MTFLTAASILTSRSSAASASTRPAFTATRMMSAFSRSVGLQAEKGQAEVVLVGCGAPNRGMGWYHGLQMVEKK